MYTIDIKTQTAPPDNRRFDQNESRDREILTKEINRLLATASPKAIRCAYILLLHME